MYLENKLQPKKLQQIDLEVKMPQKFGTNNLLKVKQATSKIAQLVFEVEMYKLRFN